MKTWIRTLALALLAAALPAAAVVMPMRIPFQGKLIDPATNNPKNGQFSMQFKLYSVPTGGTVLFTETQSVTVVNGQFSVQIGTVALLGEDLFSGASAYLGITVGADAEMLPRQPLSMSPYAYTAVQLAQDGDIRINPGIAYSTFTAAGNLTLQYGLVGTTGTFTGNAFSVGGSSFTVGGGSATVAYLLTANHASINAGATPSGTLDVQRNASDDYALQISSNDGTAMLAVGKTGSVVALATMSVLGNAFSVGGGSFTVSGGSSTAGYQLSAGSFLTTASMTASGFFGNGSALTGIGIDSFTINSQVVPAATTALLAGSVIAVPGASLQVGTVFTWDFTLSKTAAGTAANTYLVKVGVNGTTADATVATLATGLGTAAVDSGRGSIMFTIRGPLGASCLGSAHLTLTHNLASTGLLVIPAANVDATPTTAINSTTANLKVSLSVTTAAATVLTFQQVTVEARNL